MQKIKFLYYSPISWPFLKQRLPSFPHTNQAFNAIQAIELYNDSLKLFQQAESNGFDWLGIGEEHMNAYGVVPNPCLIGSILSRLTTQSKICMLGNPLPLLNPIRVAEEYSMIDILSNGRLVAGFPRGVPQNYAAYNINPEHSKEQLNEAVSLIIKSWQNKGPFDWNGTYYNFKGVSIWPQPMRIPDLVFSAKSQESILLAVRHKGIIGELYVKNESVIEHFKNSIKSYISEANENGWIPSDEKFLLCIPCFIGNTDQDAYDKAETAMSYFANVITGSFENEKKELQDIYGGVTTISKQQESIDEKISYGGIICGSPHTVVRQLESLLSNLSVGIIGLQMQVGNCGYQAVQESLHLFGSFVRDKF